MTKFMVALFLLAVPLAHAAEIGKPAPDFSVKSSEGKTVSLKDFKGKTVVLEWLNYGCPFVKKHYGSNNMQTLQEKYKKKGAVWLSVISSAKNKQGYSTPEKAEADRKKQKSAATAILLDETGTMGKAYGAETTPHMFVIDKAGMLVYQGAIDDKDSTEQSDIKIARSFVSEALDLTLAGKAVVKTQEKSYGCGIKYN